MALSTIVMTCNFTGPLNVSNLAGWGIVSIDQSNEKTTWVSARPMDCDGMLLQQARALKAASPSTHVWVYRNSIKICPFGEAEQRVLRDPAYAAWFLQYKRGGSSFINPPCDPNWSPPLCSPLYHDQWGWPGFPAGNGPFANCSAPNCDCGGVPSGEYYADFRNKDTVVNGQSLREWYVHNYTVSLQTLLSGSISGLFMDDLWDGSPSEVSNGMQNDTGLSNSDFAAITSGYNAVVAETQTAIVAAGGFVWQAFVNNGTAAGPVVPEGTDCATTLRTWCAADSPSQTGALLYGFTRGQNATDLPAFEQDLVNFLLIRGPYAWLGFTWAGCGVTFPRPALLDADFGEPLGLCAETARASGVFLRRWTKASVSLDCDTWTPSIVWNTAEAPASDTSP